MRVTILLLACLLAPVFSCGGNGGETDATEDTGIPDTDAPDRTDGDAPDQGDPAPDLSDPVGDDPILDPAGDDGPPGDQGLAVGSSGHYLQFRGRPVILIGDSVTQGWMELGTGFNQEAWLDALAGRGLNVAMIWSYIGIEDQTADARIGYDAPEIWPWNASGSGFDLNALNDAYLDRLRDLAEAADERDLVLLVTVHDGGVKWRFGGHPFNTVHGGPLEVDAQYVELFDFDAEVPGPYDAGWERTRRNQYFQELFCHGVIEALGGMTNMIYEMFNEGEWYNQDDLLRHEARFLDFFDDRTASLLAVNDDHVGGSDADFQDHAQCDIITYHRPNWDASSSADIFFDHYASAFASTPAKPAFFSEPVPSFEGAAGDLDAVMRMTWGTALGGAGFVLQNDASFGFDPASAMAAQSAGRDAALDLMGHAARLLADPDFDLESMHPDGSAASPGVALVQAGEAWIVYSQSGATLDVDLSSASGTFMARFYDPRTGAFEPEAAVEGGASRTFTKPSVSDWVLVITR